MQESTNRHMAHRVQTHIHMIFLQELDSIAQDLVKHREDMAGRTTPVNAAYRETIQIIQRRVDQLAYVFIVAPFCYDTEQMYDKLKYTLCRILQLLQTQQHQLKSLIAPDDEDFLMVLSESLTKMCVQMLCESNFIQIDIDAVTMQ